MVKGTFFHNLMCKTWILGGRLDKGTGGVETHSRMPSEGANTILQGRSRSRVPRAPMDVRSVSDSRLLLVSFLHHSHPHKFIFVRYIA